ncbi:ATP-grasp domain-containing protein [Xanthocytophaga agilis]|uniref:ATP-grasp domain-containing protein n=1 Tax=Xanthocytophaga agilis TaxID=3048010 RepID=A0AAE3RBK1_9BACT|nr:ATP-grasp domain-containing protein [Xanthocytophaga agilis]MDJ1506930.1 ATP-grasp domain-containing protein [Xanthocytophaga agilis]
MNRYNSLQWVVQRMLTDSNDIQKIRQACESVSIDFFEVDIIPFTDQLPEFPLDKQSIFYGSTNFMNLVYAHPELRKGLFLDKVAFTIENYLSKWQRYMLNSDALVVTFQELMAMPYNEDQLLFIRPNEDSKAFAGETRFFKDIADWYYRLTQIENINLSLDTKIIVGEPYNIKKEWRLWIVNKKVVAASQYREYFKLKKVEGCPQEVIAFAEQRCQEYTPHPIFVMDIGHCGDSLYIIECNCMNSAGFYKADIAQIIHSVTNSFANMF